MKSMQSDSVTGILQTLHGIDRDCIHGAGDEKSSPRIVFAPERQNFEPIIKVAVIEGQAQPAVIMNRLFHQRTIFRMNFSKLSANRINAVFREIIAPAGQCS